MLVGKRVMVVEDEWFIAQDITTALIRSGASVLGPVASVGEGLQLLDDTAGIPDAATLNVRLDDGESYPLADVLVGLGVPIMFVSATAATSLPARFARVPVLTKPINSQRVACGLEALLGSSA